MRHNNDATSNIFVLGTRFVVFNEPPPEKTTFPAEGPTLSNPISWFPRLQLWSFEFGRHEGCFAEKHQSPVTALAFLDPFPVLLSADATGNLALWALPPAREDLR